VRLDFHQKWISAGPAKASCNLDAMCDEKMDVVPEVWHPHHYGTCCVVLPYIHGASAPSTHTPRGSGALETGAAAHHATDVVRELLEEQVSAAGGAKGIPWV